MIRKNKITLISAGTLFLLSLVISYDSTAVPEWKLRVVDKAGKPIIGAEVTQKWGDASLEFGATHENSLLTDTDGYVVFPKRTVNASLFRRVWSLALTPLALLNPHAGQGSFAFVDSPPNGFAMYREGGELATQVTVHD